MPATDPPTASRTTTATDRPARAFLRLDTLGEVARSRRALNTTLAVPCPRHPAAGPGEPCWEVANSIGTQPHLAVCNARVEHARDVRDQRLAREQAARLNRRGRRR